MRHPLPIILLLLAAIAAADEITIGGEASICRRGDLVAIQDGRSHREYIFSVDRVVLISGARDGQPGSTTDITIQGCGFTSASTVIRIPERTLPYAAIRAALMR